MFGKVDLQIFITQLRSCKGAWHDVMQLGAGMRPQRRSIGKQHIERAYAVPEIWNNSSPVSGPVHSQAVGRACALAISHDPAKGPFAIGITHRGENGCQARMKIFKMAIVRKHPVMAPKLAY